jgi:hypothetical protein
MNLSNSMELLLGDNTLLYIEQEVAKGVKCEIYRENLPLLVGFINEEIISSDLSITEIKDFMDSNKERIIAFGIKLLADSSPKSLSTGVAISYSIYMIYLREREKELLEYIKRRRIPQPQKLLTKLQKIKREMNV